MNREIFKCWDLVRLILEVWRYRAWCSWSQLPLFCLLPTTFSFYAAMCYYHHLQHHITSSQENSERYPYIADLQGRCSVLQYRNKCQINYFTRVASLTDVREFYYLLLCVSGLELQICCRTPYAIRITNPCIQGRYSSHLISHIVVSNQGNNCNTRSYSQEIPPYFTDVIHWEMYHW